MPWIACEMWASALYAVITTLITSLPPVRPEAGQGVEGDPCESEHQEDEKGESQPDKPPVPVGPQDIGATCQDTDDHCPRCYDEESDLPDGHGAVLIHWPSPRSAAWMASPASPGNGPEWMERRGRSGRGNNPSRPLDPVLPVNAWMEGEVPFHIMPASPIQTVLHHGPVVPQEDVPGHVRLGMKPPETRSTHHEGCEGTFCLRPHFGRAGVVLGQQQGKMGIVGVDERGSEAVDGEAVMRPDA